MYPGDYAWDISAATLSRNSLTLHSGRAARLGPRANEPRAGCHWVYLGFCSKTSARFIKKSGREESMRNASRSALSASSSFPSLASSMPSESSFCFGFHRLRHRLKHRGRPRQTSHLDCFQSSSLPFEPSIRHRLRPNPSEGYRKTEESKSPRPLSGCPPGAARATDNVIELAEHALESIEQPLFAGGHFTKLRDFVLVTSLFFNQACLKSSKEGFRSSTALTAALRADGLLLRDSCWPCWPRLLRCRPYRGNG